MLWIIAVMSMLMIGILVFAGVSGIVWVVGTLLGMEWSWLLVALIWLIVMGIIVALTIKGAM